MTQNIIPRVEFSPVASSPRAVQDFQSLPCGVLVGSKYHGDGDTLNLICLELHGGVLVSWFVIWT